MDSWITVDVVLYGIGLNLPWVRCGVTCGVGKAQAAPETRVTHWTLRFHSCNIFNIYTLEVDFFNMLKLCQLPRLLWQIKMDAPPWHGMSGSLPPFASVPGQAVWENIGMSSCGWPNSRRSFNGEKLQRGSCEQDPPHDQNVGYPIPKNWTWMQLCLISYLSVSCSWCKPPPISYWCSRKSMSCWYSFGQNGPTFCQLDHLVWLMHSSSIGISSRTPGSPKDVYLVSQGLIDGFNGAIPCYTSRYSHLYELSCLYRHLFLSYMMLCGL